MRWTGFPGPHTVAAMNRNSQQTAGPDWKVVAERRTKVAHGETVGRMVEAIQAPDGAIENQPRKHSVAPAGAWFVLFL